MADAEFTVRVRGADQMRYYTFDGVVAAELGRLLTQGALDRPPGAHRLAELIASAVPVRTEPRASTADAEVDWDMVDDDQLRTYLSQRLLERKGGRESDAAIQDEPDQPPGGGTTL